MQTVSPALFSVGTDERDLRPRIGPDHFIVLALHKSDEVLLAPALFHGLPDVVHQLELPALALLCRTPSATIQEYSFTLFNLPQVAVSFDDYEGNLKKAGFWELKGLPMGKPLA